MFRLPFRDPLLQASDGNPSRGLTFAAGILSILVVGTFKLGERAELHRTAANGFGKVMNELEVFLCRPHPDSEKAWDELDAIIAEIGSVEAGAPGYLRRTYNKAREQLEKDFAKRRQHRRPMPTEAPATGQE